MTAQTPTRTASLGRATASLVLVLLVPAVTVIAWSTAAAATGMQFDAASAALPTFLLSFVVLGGTSLALAIGARRRGSRAARVLATVTISLFGVLALLVALVLIVLIVVVGTPAFRG